MNKIKITRKQLYDLVWSLPVKDVAIKLNTSDIEVRKICKANHITLPANGHWMKLRFGKKVNLIPLDESINVNQELEIIENLRNRRKELDTISSSNMADEISKKVTSKLINPDILIKQAKKNSEDKNGYRQPEELIILREGLNIKASRSLFNRALCFMDTLLKIFRSKVENPVILTT